MDISTIIIIVLAAILYLAISYIAVMIHYLNSSQKITGVKRVLLAPAEFVFMIFKRILP